MGERTERIALRCTYSEKERLTAEAGAAGVTLSELIFMRALGAVSSGPPNSATPSSEKGLGGNAPATEGDLSAPEVASPTASPRAPSRTCERCKAPVGSPTMRYHGCGGKVIPPPGRLT